MVKESDQNEIEVSVQEKPGCPSGCAALMSILSMSGFRSCRMRLMFILFLSHVTLMRSEPRSSRCTTASCKCRRPSRVSNRIFSGQLMKPMILFPGGAGSSFKLFLVDGSTSPETRCFLLGGCPYAILNPEQI